jgi:hypothetical protein
MKLENLKDAREKFKKEELEASSQLFRSYFNPSEVVFDYYNIGIKIPDEPSTNPIVCFKQRHRVPTEKLPLECLPRVYTQEEITEITELCEAMFTESIQAGKSSPHILTAIDEIFDFFNLLSKPENHIKVPSGQYVEKHVNVRPVHDMTNEMAKEIGKLPRFQAYTKIISENENEQVVSVHRIQTNPLPNITNTIHAMTAIAMGHAMGKDRDAIEEEIRQRQAQWLPGKNLPPTQQRRD